MKCRHAAIVLLLTGATAFQIPPPRGRTMTALLGYRASYQHYLEELSRKQEEEGVVEKTTTDSIVPPVANGAVQPPGDKVVLTEEQQKERAEAQKRVDAIQELIDANWKEQEATIHALRVEIIKQETDVIIADTSRTGEAPDVKIEAQLEAMAVVDQYKAKEEELREELMNLQVKMEEEKQGQVQPNQDVADSIITAIVGMAEGLDALLEQYDEESKAWLSKLEAEQAEWELEAQLALIAEAEAEVARLREQVHGMEEEKAKEKSLFKRTLKAVIDKARRG